MKKRNVTWFMTGVAMAGVVCTAIASAKATLKAKQTIDEIEAEAKQELTPTEKVTAVWSYYVPTAFIALVSMTCTLSGTILDKKQQAALAGAYALIENSYHNYTEGVKELYGQEAHERVVSHILAQKAEKKDLYVQDWLASSLDFKDDAEDVPHLYYLECMDKFFVSTNNRVLQAIYHFNRNFMFAGSLPVAMLADFLGIELTNEERDKAMSVGWDMSNGDLYWVDFNFFQTTRLDIENEYCPDGIIRVIQTPYWPTEPYGDDWY